MSDTSVQTAVTSTPAVPAVPVVPVAESARPAASTRKTWPGKKVLMAVASLRLTVVLFALSLILVFVGTLAQKDTGIWTVVTRYFESWVVWVPFQVFFPSRMEIGGSFPFFGGALLGSALLVNIIAAHAVRFRTHWNDLFLLPAFVAAVALLAHFGANFVEATFSDVLLASCRILFLAAVLGGIVLVHGKRGGVLVLHLGVIVLMSGELMTRRYAVEGNLTVLEGQSVNFVEVREDNELAFVDPSDSRQDRHIVVPAALLRKGVRVSSGELPFDVQLVQYMTNSKLVNAAAAKNSPATAGLGLTLAAQERPEVSGADPNQQRDVASAYVQLYEKGTDNLVGTYLVSLWLTLDSEQPKQRVRAGDKTYEMALRWKRVYKPYTVQLLEFRHGRYKGTGIAKDFTSVVRLVDKDNNVDREVAISMNNPLRYRGETFFQASVVGDDVGTVLQVVKNPGWRLPYLACILVALGMLIHFGFHLHTFLSRRAAA